MAFEVTQCLFLLFLHRTVHRVEIEAVSEFLLHLLTGDVDKLPTEALIHHFWTKFVHLQKHVGRYSACLRKHGLTDVECYHDVGKYCGPRFGQRAQQRLDQCRHLLANERNVTTMDVAPNVARIFAKYRSCVSSVRRRLDANCADVLRKSITDRRLRTAKVVRATMNSMGPLLRALPTLRVIHLVRDPRAVAVSRSRWHESVRGMYTKHTRKSESRIVAEASLYCHHVTVDIRARLALDGEFPGRILSVRYEDVVAKPGQIFRDIYKFIDEPMPNVTLGEMQKMARTGLAMKLTTNWQSRMTYAEGITIARQCAELFHLMNT